MCFIERHSNEPSISSSLFLIFMPTNMIALDGHGSPAEHDCGTLWGSKLSTQFMLLAGGEVS